MKKSPHDVPGPQSSPGLCLLLTAALLVWGLAPRAQSGPPPGVIVDRSPDFEKVYVGCPSIAILPDGRYVASHSWFGPGTGNDSSEVFASADRGESWQKLTSVQGQWWSTLFTHRGALYIAGVSRQYGDIVIRRSTDGGKTWTQPEDGRSGLLFQGKYHCAPVPVIAHGGRLWRAWELAEGPRPLWAALVLSAPEEADLLDAGSWRMSEPLRHLWSKSQWIEGNLVASPEGQLLNILRTDNGPDRASVVRVSEDGTRLSHAGEQDLIPFPGGGSKFTIRFDPQTKRYWSIGNKQSDPPAGRNVLVLTSSSDLRSWKVETILLQHGDSQHHAWQYVDWLFDGADIVAVSRTAWDGSHNFHDANYLTFHRFSSFRTRTLADAAPVLREEVSHETADLVLRGAGWSLARLADQEKAFANRKYVWQNVPDRFRDWQFTQTQGGVCAEIRVQAKRGTALYAATAAWQTGVDLAGWNLMAADAFRYTDHNRSAMNIYSRDLPAGAGLSVPQGNWSGMLLLLPPPGAAGATP